MRKLILPLIAVAMLCASCEDLIDPAIENNKTLDDIYTTQDGAAGILGNAYVQIPYSYQSVPQSDVASDDAVTNDITSGYLKAATGAWTAMMNPFEQWQARYSAIQSANLFLAKVRDIEWSPNHITNEMFVDRMSGEAYALRALNMYFLLQAHGGMGSGGKMLGVQVITKPLTADSNFNIPRSSYKATVEQIVKDLDRAIELLPYDYDNQGDMTNIPQKYKDMGLTAPDSYNRVSGSHMKGRISGRIAKAIKVQTLMMAASPAFSAESGVAYSDVVECAAELLSGRDLSMTGNQWYIDNVDNYSAGINPDEVLWRANITEDNAVEALCFPPTLYGLGRVNPSQNLVDAFPMKSGYPIGDGAANYDPQDPYKDRDPRLGLYIIYDNQTQGSSNAAIVTGAYGTSIDALNRESGRSTRTGYYMRKLTNASCNPDPVYNGTKKHMSAYIRYTELFLDLAEAANEAYSGTVPGSMHTSYSIIKKIRERAGIDYGDPYLESIKNDPDKMRELIRNERRLELCFENQRFWDLRRWGLVDVMKEDVRGMSITENTNGVLEYTPITVEKRQFEDYMLYGPIPHAECLKWSNLEQNKGW